MNVRNSLPSRVRFLIYFIPALAPFAVIVSGLDAPGNVKLR
jgi:hypothetical protein